MKNFLFLFIPLILSFQGCSLSDIRTEMILTDGIIDKNTNKGKLLLIEAMDAHGGLDKWKSLKTAETTLTDEWFGFLPRTFFKPWKNSPQEIKQQMLLGNDNSRITLLGGKNKGDVWGIQSWETYIIPNSKELEFTNDKTVRFVLPTIQYFFELPFRVHEAEIISYAGEKTLDEQRYDLVYATWTSPEPNKMSDQYLIYISKKTKLIEWVQFTVRDSFGFIKASVNYQDFRNIDSIQVSHEQYIYNNEPEKKDLLHKYIYSSVKYSVDLKEEIMFPDPKKISSKY